MEKYKVVLEGRGFYPLILMNYLQNEVMSKRISVVLPDDIGEVVEKMAQEEMRSLSQMGAILIAEAVRGRITEESESTLPKKSKGAAA